jgi:hypothetical protein
VIDTDPFFDAQQLTTDLLPGNVIRFAPVERDLPQCLRAKLKPDWFDAVPPESLLETSECPAAMNGAQQVFANPIGRHRVGVARDNKLENNVIFHNRFVELKELTEFIGAADVYITPYLDEAQSTSGTLAYAFGAGKAVISTPYRHAAELLRDQRGVLVPFADPRAIARALSALLRDEGRRKVMSDEAYKLGRTMVWSNTARLYMDSFEMSQQRETAPPCKSAAAVQPSAV